MTAVPARVAGVREIVMTTPGPSPETLAAARLAGVDRVFVIGGAQAIAAMAYGTESVPRVDKIVGPGNAYVAAAKRLVFGDVGIDSIAGPTEVVIAADDSVDPRWIAADLLAQAEHDELAVPILIARGEGVRRQGGRRGRRAAGRAAAPRDRRAGRCADQGAIFVVDSDDEIVRAHEPAGARARRAGAARRARAGRADHDRRARSSSACTRPSRWATTSPGPATCCRPAAARASPRRWASATSSSGRRSSNTTRAALRGAGGRHRAADRRRGSGRPRPRGHDPRQGLAGAAMNLAATLRGTTYRFRDLKQVLAKANEEKSGDRLAGLAADERLRAGRRQARAGRRDAAASCTRTRSCRPSRTRSRA